MDDIDKAMSEYERKREQERKEFLQKCMDKVKDDPQVVYDSLLLTICQRFRLDKRYVPGIVHDILGYFVENVDEPLMEWLWKDNAPFVRRLEEVKKIFHEFTCITDDELKIVELANRFYGLNLLVDYDYGGYEHYVYAYEFDFNSFTPIDMGEVKELLDEIRILEKYGMDTTELQSKLQEYGFTDGEIELIGGGE